MIYQKGYQETETVVSGVTTKVKGISMTNLSHIPAIGSRVWDVADYVMPPQVSALSLQNCLQFPSKLSLAVFASALVSGGTM